MPYIKKNKRPDLNDGINGLTYRIDALGDLNYVITKLLLDKLPDNPCYNDYVSLLGTLEAVKFELYRKVIAKYEDKKCKENGEVYGRDMTRLE